MKTCASPWPARQQPLGKPGGPVEGIRLCRKRSRGKRNAVSLFLPPQGDLAGISPTPNQHCQNRVCGSQRVKVSGGWCNLEGGDGPQACWEQQGWRTAVPGQCSLTGAGGQPQPWEALSSHLPMPRAGERSQELHPAPATDASSGGRVLQPRIPRCAHYLHANYICCLKQIDSLQCAVLNHVNQQRSSAIPTGSVSNPP